MWHEARKHEKKLRVMIVDYRKRAERRREFYEKFKADPTQFMQVHGRQCKIYVDPQVTAAADKCLVPWQGQKDTLIDRFDARAHLDYVPESAAYSKAEETTEEYEEPALNYERYRILVQNDLAGISEDKFLHQIHIEEQFGTAAPTPFKMLEGKSSKLTPKAAISYNYEDSTPNSSTVTKLPQVNTAEEDSEDDVDFDLIVNVSDLTIAQTSELNHDATLYGMAPGSFMTFLNADIQEREQIRLSKLQEEEKQTMSGRKARRERRAFKDRIILRKGYISPPSYAAAANQLEGSGQADEASSHSDSDSRSRAASPEKITFITSFGENESEKEKNLGNAPLVGPSLPYGGLPRTTHKKWTRHRSNSRTLKPRRTRSRSGSSFRAKHRHRSSRSSSNDWSRYRRGGHYSRSPKRNSSYGSRRHRKSSSSSSSSSESDKHKSRSSRYEKTRRSRYSRSRSRSHNKRHRSRRSFSRSDSPRSRRSHRRSLSRDRRKSRSPAQYSSRKRSPLRRSSSSTSTSSREEKSPVVKNSNGNGNTENETVNHSALSPPPVKRYYGRQGLKNEEEDSPLSVTSSEDETGPSRQKSPLSRSYGRSSSIGENTKSVVSSSSKVSGKYSTTQGLTPQERLKRRMQSALNKQLRADKEAEKTRQERQEQERIEREESLRELSIKYRRRERERRHRDREMSDSYSDSSESDKNSSRSHSSGT